MALIKKINLDNGITVNYHRVVSVNNITNHSSIIEIASYTSKEKRQEEIKALESHKRMNVFIEADYMVVPYNPELNVNSAYEYLKTTKKYRGAEDDVEIKEENSSVD